MATAASPPTKPRLPSWKGRQPSNGGRVEDCDADVLEPPEVLGDPGEVGGEEDHVGGDARVDPRLGGDHAGIARRAHGRDRHGRTVEVVLLHHHGDHGRRHHVDPLPSAGPWSLRPVEVAPHLDVAEDDQWTTPTTGPGCHPRSRASVMASRAAKRRACMKRLGPSVGRLRRGWWRRRPRRRRRSPSSPVRQPDRALPEQEAVPEVLGAPAVAGDRADAGNTGRRVVARRARRRRRALLARHQDPSAGDRRSDLAVRLSGRAGAVRASGDRWFRYRPAQEAHNGQSIFSPTGILRQLSPCVLTLASGAHWAQTRSAVEGHSSRWHPRAAPGRRRA